MNMEEMKNKITIFYDDENMIKMVLQGIGESALYNKIVIDKKDLNLNIQDLINKKIILKEGQEPSFSILEKEGLNEKSI